MDEDKQPAKIPNDKQLSKVRASLQSFSGPIPHPSTLEGYERLVKGSADRIIQMAEKQVTHRHSIEKKIIKSETLNSLLGVIFAFVIAMTTVLGGVWVMVNGSVWGGGFLGAAGLLGLVSVFIYGTRSRREEREKKK